MRQRLEREIAEAETTKKKKNKGHKPFELPKNVYGYLISHLKRSMGSMEVTQSESQQHGCNDLDNPSDRSIYFGILLPEKVAIQTEHYNSNIDSQQQTPNNPTPPTISNPRGGSYQPRMFLHRDDSKNEKEATLVLPPIRSRSKSRFG